LSLLSTQGHNGQEFKLWRHRAIRYTYGGDANGGYSEISVFVDGAHLCGQSFPTVESGIPHLRQPGSGRAFSAAVMEEGWLEPGSAIRDMRLYPYALNSSYLKSIGRAPAVVECMDLETIQNNMTYKTSFGQTCSDIAQTRMVDGLDVACALPEVWKSCPVSCYNVDAPPCWDGIPPLYQYSTEVDSISRGNLIETERANWLESSWHTLWTSIEVVDGGTTILAANASVEPIQLMHKTSGSMEGLCNAAFTVDRDEQSQNNYHYEAASLITDICRATQSYIAELQETTDLSDYLSYVSPEQPGFEPGLLPSGEDWTLLFWAKPAATKAIQDIALTGADEEGRVCFHIHGNKAGVPTYTQDWAEAAVDVSRDGTFFFPHIELPGAASRRDDWMFFSVSMDYTMRLNDGEEHRFARFTFLVDDEYSSTEIDLSTQGDIGCSSMKKILVTGEEFELSPIRVAERSLSVGRLQLLRLTSRPVVADLRGPLRSRAMRLRAMELPKRPYPLATMAMSPPLVLQLRGSATPIDDPDSGFCKEGTVFQRVQAGLSRTEQKQCKFPFMCDRDSPSAMANLCPKTTDAVPDRFFGREWVYRKGVEMFPEFPWILVNSQVVRNGTTYIPHDEYIDSHTKQISCLFSFFTVATQIATVVQVDFDLARTRVEPSVTFLQVRVMSWGEFSEWLGWTVTAMVCIIIFGIQAVPAAIAELNGFFSFFRGCRVSPGAAGPNSAKAESPSQTRPISPSVLSPLRSRYLPFGRQKIIPATYNANTTQPDLLDVILSQVLTAFLIYAIVQAQHKIKTAPEIFGAMSEIDWSNDEKLFSEKVSDFLLQLRDALTLTEDDELLLTWAFWLLIVCGIRVIVFMGIHPFIEGVYATFITVGRELVNFLLSFGIIFMFLAFIAHIRFGYKYDEFRTIEQSMITQFAILVGDGTPAYSDDPLMTFYVVAFVFICTMALLNFLLAIVVEGYTKVSERALGNAVVVSLLADIYAAVADLFCWRRHKSWPSKRELLNIIMEDYHNVISPVDGLTAGISAIDLHAILGRYGVSVSLSDIEELFQHYGRFTFLIYDGKNGD